MTPLRENASPDHATTTPESKPPTRKIVVRRQRTRLDDYAGLDWQRSLFWAVGNGLVVIDELTARQAGDYVTRCTWRTLGEADLVGQTVHARQRGEHRRGNRHLQVIEDAGRTVVELAHRDARIAFTQDFAPGQHSVNIIAKGRDGSSDSLFLLLDDGSPMDYHIPQKDYGDSGGNWDRSAANKPLTVETAGPHRLTLTLRESPGTRIDAIVFTAPNGRVTRLEAEDLVKGEVEIVDEPEQHLFLVNGDGSPLTLKEQFDYGHGGADGYYARYAFAADGKLLWRTETVRLSTVGCAADFNGDRHEGVVAGTVYYWPKLLGADGKILANFSGGPVTSAVAATDLDGDGKSEALIGMEDCFVRAAKTTGGWMWQANVGGTPTAIVPLPGNEPRLAVSTDGFGVAFLDGKGTRVAYAALPQAVPGLALAGAQLVAPCEDSQAYLISPDGKIVGRSPLPARPHAVATLDEHSAVVACGATLVLVPTGE